MKRLAAAAWALAALALAEAGTRHAPLWVGGLLPLAAVLALAALTGAPGLPRAAGAGATGAARLAMLPMMASLPAMGSWCSAAGLAPATMALLHVLAMTAPMGLSRPAPEAGVRVLLLAGGVALLAVPGVQGLMAAATLHALAAGWACAGPGDTEPARSRAVPRAPVLALVPAVGVLLLGTALDRFGPSALQALHAALAGVALLPLRRRHPHPMPGAAGLPRASPAP